MDSGASIDPTDDVNSRGGGRKIEDRIVYTRRARRKARKTSSHDNTSPVTTPNTGASAENPPDASPPAKVSSPAAAPATATKVPTPSASGYIPAPSTPPASSAHHTVPHGNAGDDTVTDPLETLETIETLEDKDADSFQERVEFMGSSNEAHNSKTPTGGGPPSGDDVAPTLVSSPISEVPSANVLAQPLVISEVNDRVRFKIAKATRKDEIKKLRKRLESELVRVGRLFKQLEEKKELHLASYNPPPNKKTSLVINTQPSHARTDLVDRRIIVRVNSERPMMLARANSDIGVPRIEPRLPYGSQLGVRVNEYAEPDKEKRTPKANQYYRNSDFLLGKDRLPPENVKRLKKNNGRRQKFGSRPSKTKNPLSKSCGSLLQRLVKHKHGWVFSKPVDAQALGLADYHDIIKQPMDLGTIKTKLSQNQYKFPSEFAEDVRLVFRNAMTYNPVGHDVHIMADQLLSVFEEKWAAIDAENIPYWKSEVYQDLNPETNRRSHVGRTPVPKKPRARDVVKRDMTYDEKQRLSTSLQSMPFEKLDAVVQIIKRRNTALSHNDDEEIEVDIDNIDTETLWELDRFVMNYRKTLSMHKRKAELAAVQGRGGANQATDLMNTTAVADGRVDSGTAFGKKTAPPAGEDKRQGYNGNSSSSSSDSGSSSSDSDSDSSSESGSDAPGT